MEKSYLLSLSICSKHLQEAALFKTQVKRPWKPGLVNDLKWKHLFCFGSFSFKCALTWLENTNFSQIDHRACGFLSWTLCTFFVSLCSEWIYLISCSRRENRRMTTRWRTGRWVLDGRFLSNRWVLFGLLSQTQLNERLAIYLLQSVSLDFTHASDENLLYCTVLLKSGESTQKLNFQILFFQGYLYKKSTKPLNKEWKKKYVALSDDGKIIYHPSLHVSHGISFQVVWRFFCGGENRHSLTWLSVFPKRPIVLSRALFGKIVTWCFSLSQGWHSCVKWSIWGAGDLPVPQHCLLLYCPHSPPITTTCPQHDTHTVQKRFARLEYCTLQHYVFLQDYMDDVHGKEIVLARTTVKVPGMRPRGSRPAMPMTNPNHSSDGNSLGNRSEYPHWHKRLRPEVKLLVCC